MIFSQEMCTITQVLKILKFFYKHTTQKCQLLFSVDVYMQLATFKITV